MTKTNTKPNGEQFVDVVGAWARSMVDGETLIGTYCGYDEIVMRNGVRKRHYFVDVVRSAPDADGQVTTESLDRYVIFGAVEIDNTLRSVDLGLRARIVRRGKVDGQRRVAYQIGVGTAPADTRHVIGRNDLVAPTATFGPGGWGR
jgi:hypothetical protein